MKNATKHADELKSLLRKLWKEHKPQPSEPVPPMRALVHGAMSYDLPDATALEAMKHIDREYVDLNELRVATELELIEVFSERYPAIEQRVTLFLLALNGIFDKEGLLTIERVKELNKRDIRQFLRDLPGMHPFVEAYTMLYGFDSSAFPIDDTMLDYLVEQEILEEGTTLHDAQKFIENQLKSDEMFPAFVALRQAALASKGRKKKGK